jgi:hypothetical protein
MAYETIGLLLNISYFDEELIKALISFERFWDILLQRSPALSLPTITNNQLSRLATEYRFA